MIKRTLFITNAVCLTLKSKQLIILNKETQEENSVPIEDVGFLIIENNQVYISIPLINELANNNSSIVFCDEKHMPFTMTLPLECNSTQNQIFSTQIKASIPIQKNCWKMIIEQKIKNQGNVLEKHGYNSKYIFNLAKEVKSDDTTNREGIAAKFYWGTLFGDNWTRDRFGEYPNNLLNYGYAVLRAATARALIGSGLLPTLGIHHHNKYNAFALADDVMEPYRPFIDDLVLNYTRICKNQELTVEFKKHILSALTMDVAFKKVTRPLMIGLSFTTSSLVKVLTGEVKKLSLPNFI